jgi:hypothetical protein
MKTYQAVQRHPLIDSIEGVRLNVSELQSPTGLLFICQVNVSMESHGDDDASC